MSGRVTIEWSSDDFRIRRGRRGLMRAGLPNRNPVVCHVIRSEAYGVRNVPDGEHLGVMTRMATQRLAAIWLPKVLDKQHFIHPANTPEQLRGCIAPGLIAVPSGVQESQSAMLEIFEALGGWQDLKEVLVIMRGGDR